ncbi:hypothetical protein R1sor_010003 [Riccia sorocarpa]|uniref:Uncharacterized protein n=1 Tax=Riccia sorocarpa TaxID=122646 RepID=A0ABD3HWQ8_9MARC
MYVVMNPPNLGSSSSLCRGSEIPSLSWTECVTRGSSVRPGGRNRLWSSAVKWPNLVLLSAADSGEASPGSRKGFGSPKKGGSSKRYQEEKGVVLNNAARTGDREGATQLSKVIDVMDKGEIAVAQAKPFPSLDRWVFVGERYLQFLVDQLFEDSGKTRAGKLRATPNGSDGAISQQRSNRYLECSSLEVASKQSSIVTGACSASVAALSLFLVSDTANADILNPAYGEVGALLEAGVQLIYLGALIILLGVGSFLVVRQVLIKRELETAAKDLQERVRSGDASSLEYFELGAVMLRKKYYQLANKYLDQAIKKWDDSEQDLAQVYNALGFSYFSDGKIEKAIAQYEKAVQLQPGYVIAWNNLADAYENQKEYLKALKAYEQALQLDPKNKVASAGRELMKTRVDRFQGIP